MNRKKLRLTIIGAALLTLGASTALALYALRDNVAFFLGPTDLVQKKIDSATHLRVGGLVKTGSIEKIDGEHTHFVITDNSNEIAVDYTGQLPDLFRDNQGVVVEGTLPQANLFRAETILAKHDERYMSREVADALKKQGTWNPDSGKTPTSAKQ